MAEVLVIGGGIAGLGATLLLAKDGHQVTLLERDPAPPPASADAAWDDWERRGVGQFRMLHFFLPRFRALLDAELPEVATALEADGANRWNPMELYPDFITGGPREGDVRFTALTGRRPMVEAALARVVQAADGVTVRRGVAVRGLLTADERDRQRLRVRAARGGGRDGDRRSAPRRSGGGRVRSAVGPSRLAGWHRCSAGHRGARRLRLRVLRTSLPIAGWAGGGVPGRARGPTAAIRLHVHPHPAGRQRHLVRRTDHQRQGPRHAAPP